MGNAMKLIAKALQAILQSARQSRSASGELAVPDWREAMMTYAADTDARWYYERRHPEG
jgi:hypothetical protein